MPKVSVLFRAEEESWNSFARRIRETEGEAIVVLSSVDNNFLLQEEERRLFLTECAKLRYRVKLATKEPAVIASARKLGLRVFDKTRRLSKVLQGHPKAAEALRFFSPSLWRQQWRSKLQSIGLLSLPKLRIWLLIALSCVLFLFVVFRLLPSAEIRIWPREDVVTQTMNILLVASGAGVRLPEHVRTLPLVPLTVREHRSITFSQISPEFTGTDAEVTMTVFNKKAEPVGLRTGTRFLNQAGMVFRSKSSVTVPAGGQATVRARADHLDIYEKVVGARGNVPAGLQWELPGLSMEERTLVYAQNKTSAAGGKTSSRMVLQRSDLDKAKDVLQRELLAAAREAIEERRQELNARGDQRLEFLSFRDLIKTTYSGVVLPTQFLGQPVQSVPAEGEIIHSVPAYDAQAILDKFSQELQAHVGEGKQLLRETVSIDPQRVVVIEYADNLSWIKITVDIVGREQFLLDALSPTGIKFGKRVRDAIAGLGKEDALRIIKNLPEVERAEVSVWPPWSAGIPTIPSNISIAAQ